MPSDNIPPPLGPFRDPDRPMVATIRSEAEPGPLRISLTVVAGPHKGKVFHFTGHDTFMVGRSKQAHFQMPREDRYFSRFHFLVEVNPPFCRLLDLGSRNGTFVNKQRVATANLADGDLIRGGHTTLRVSMQVETGERTDSHSGRPSTTSPSEVPLLEPPLPTLEPGAGIRG